MSNSILILYKKAYGGLSAESWSLSVVMLVNRCGSMVSPFLAIYCVDRLHFTIVQAGYILALSGIGAILGSFAGGKLSDKFGFYNLQVIALGGGGILLLVLGYQHTFLPLSCGVFALSFCNDAFRPANNSAIAYYSGMENKARSFSLNRLAANLGWSIGAALGGFLASFSYQSLFWVDGITNIIAAILLLRLLPHPDFIKLKNKNLNVNHFVPPHKDRIFIVFIILVGITALGFFQLFNMVPIFYKTQWRLNEISIGILMSSNGILVVLFEMIAINWLEGKVNQLKSISLGSFLVALSFFLFNVLPAGLMSGLVISLVFTFGEMLSVPFINTWWIKRTNDLNRGSYSGLHSMAWSTAQVLAPSAGSMQVARWGFRSLWWTIGAASALASLGFLWLSAHAINALPHNH